MKPSDGDGAAPGAPAESLVSIETLATRWLAAERLAEARGNAGGTEDLAREAGAAYDEAVSGASVEDLLLSWQGARQLQEATVMGSEDWGHAREVAELLRVEYLARRD